MRSEQQSSEVLTHLWWLAARSDDQFIAVEIVKLCCDEIVGPKMFILRLLQGMLTMEIAMKRMMMPMVQSLINDDAFKMIWMINVVMIRNSH